MVLPGDGLIPFLQPNLGYKQEEVILELHSLAWNIKRSYTNWFPMHAMLDNEQKKARHIEANGQIKLTTQRNQAQQNQAPQVPPPQQN